MKKSQIRQLKRVWKGVIRHWLGWGVLAILLIPTVAIAHNRQLWPPTQTAQGTEQTSAALTFQPGETLAQAPETNEEIHAEVAQITLDALLAGTDEPTTEPEVYRTTIQGDYALATWRWGEGGGQSILSQESGDWQVLSAGGGVVDVSILEELGVPADIAQTLIEQDQADWE
ncbi:MAG: hypothetical protein AAFY67_06715 [Cyanobacteria bacterium J06642_9]